MMHGGTRMAEITQFSGILPPAGQAAVAPSGGAENLIHWALAPLQVELNAALARCDQERALRIAYGALGRVADALAAMRGDTILPDQVRVHALLVQLMPLPPESQFDGTIAETGTQVEINYRNWAVAREEAEAWAQRLTQQYQSFWPGAWVMMSS
jgi:hypothetical protein